MTKEEFIIKVKEIIDTTAEIDENTILAEIEEWDSVAILGLLSLYDELNVEIDVDEFENFKTMKDLLEKGNID